MNDKSREHVAFGKPAVQWYSVVVWMALAAPPAACAVAGVGVAVGALAARVRSSAG